MKTFLEKNDIVVSPADEEVIIRDLYADIDRAARKELKRLHEEDGVVPTCREGCFHCCGQHILISEMESHAIIRYVKKYFSARQIATLKVKARKWHEWNDLRGDALLAAIREPHDRTFKPAYYCPLLVDGVCSAYAMRPVTCRTHFVSSQPIDCRSPNDPAYSGVSALKFFSVTAAVDPFLQKLKQLNVAVSADRSQWVMLLPQWLAIELQWEFAVQLSATT